LRHQDKPANGSKGGLVSATSTPIIEIEGDPLAIPSGAIEALAELLIDLAEAETDGATELRA
jgi:hypothetical protein